MSTSDTPRSSEKKRVRFKEEEAEVREYESLDNPRKTRKKVVQPDAIARLQGEISAVNIDSSPQEDPRRHRRPISAITRDLFSDTDAPGNDDGEQEEAESKDVDWDVFQEDAEVDYDEPEHLLNDIGIPFEPFNFKEERNSGYFDAASGSYIQLKKKEDVEDAWADALAATEVDARWAQAVMDRASAREVKARRKGSNGSGGGGGGDKSSNAKFSRDLSIEEIVELKQNIVSLLQPGENVLAALRRLGRTRNSITPPQQVPGETAIVEMVPLHAAASKERYQVSQLTVDTMRGGADNHHHQQQQQKQKPTSLIKRASLPPQSQLEFDQLTDWSSVLMEAGEFLIHSQTREELLNTLQGRQQHGAARHADDDEEEKVVEDIDMFAEEEVTPLENNGKQQEQQVTGLLSSQHQKQAQPEQPPSLGQPLPHKQPLEDESDHQPLLQGFVLQPDSGYYYNSSIGAYYDPQSRLFGDAGTGKWYKFNHKTGKYILS